MVLKFYINIKCKLFSISGINGLLTVGCFKESELTCSYFLPRSGRGNVGHENSPYLTPEISPPTPTHQDILISRIIIIVLIILKIVLMAAIIAQISLQAAKRRGETVEKIPIEKSNAYLPPFDRHFQAEDHNLFTKRSVLILESFIFTEC